MSLPPAVSACISRAVALFACTALLAGCTTSPTSGRTQFNILPGALETTVPDLRFDVKTLLDAGREFCKEEESPCPAQEAAATLAQRIAPIAERLGTLTAELSPELVTRVPHVEVFVVPNDSPSVSSSAGGKIAVSSGIARLELPDTDLALALAREFGRLASAHHRESTSAGLAVSLVAGSPLTSAYLATSILADIIFPMGALAKVGISLLASMGTEQLVEASQQDEADEFAGKLLLAAGYDLRKLAEARPDAPEGAVKIGWLPNYFTSRAKVAAMAPPPETTAATAGDPTLPLEAKVEVAASPIEMAGKAVAALESPTEAKLVAAAAPPDMTTESDNDQKPLTETRDEPVGPPVEMTAKAAANPGPPVAEKIEVPAPAPEMPSLALASPRPEATAKAEAAEPPRQSAETPEVQKDPPAAKSSAVKKAKQGTAKPPLKKHRKIRKPSKKPARR
jgi:hypothetical protein